MVFSLLDKTSTRRPGTVMLRYLGQQKLQRLPSSTFPYHVELVYHEARELVQLLQALRRHGRSGEITGGGTCRFVILLESMGQ